MATKKLSKKSVSPAKKSPGLPATKNIGESVLGLPLKTWISSLQKVSRSEMRGERSGVVFFIGKSNPEADLSNLTKAYLQPWQREQFLKSKNENLHFAGQKGPVWIFRNLPMALKMADLKVDDYGLTERSAHARARDCFGGLINSLMNYDIDQLIFEFHGTSLEEEKAALLGLEVGSYFYSENCNNPKKPRRRLPRLKVREDKTQLTKTDINASSELGLAMNIARHFVNLPAGTLNTQTYAEAIKKMMRDLPATQVEVWEGEKLTQERMGLLQAVGQGASEGPKLVCIHYRPLGTEGIKPIALVGKGIVFDTGGLDMKPSSGMRWMKKDMGGSAAIVGLAHWAVRTRLNQPCDFYLALAENAVGERSFRPGDIVTARNGLTVEIHNTDAEGRLVLADALDVAVTRYEKPACVIDVATLTGAIKVGLGAEIAGLFCNQDELADRLLDCAQSQGDLAWRMPLYQPYKSMMRSTFADLLNAADGFAGAITAALFLQQFVGQTPWAHWDIYAWRDSASGAWSEMGGNGQPVQALAEFLSRSAVPRESASFESHELKMTPRLIARLDDGR